MKKVLGNPGNRRSRSAPPEASEPGGVASLVTSPDAKSNTGFTFEQQDKRYHCADGISGATPSMSPSTSSRDETGMAQKESYDEAVGGEDSLRACDRVLEEALGDSGDGTKNGE